MRDKSIGIKYKHAVKASGEIGLPFVPFAPNSGFDTPCPSLPAASLEASLTVDDNNSASVVYDLTGYNG